MEAKPMKDRIQMFDAQRNQWVKYDTRTGAARSNAMENHFGAFAKLKKRGDRFPVSSF